MLKKLSFLKIAFTAFVAFFLHLESIAQYTVTKIVGQVSNKTTGEKLKLGSRLKDDDLLQFSSEKDMIRVIVSGKGVYVISPTPTKDNSTSLIVEMLKSALKIKSKEGYLSGRSEETSMIPDAFQTEGDVNTRLLISDTTHFLFDKNKFDLNNGNRFFLQAETEGGKPEIHALKTTGDTLYLLATDFGNRAGNGLAARYKIGFHNKPSNTSESLSAIKPYLDTLNEMESVINIFITNYGDEKDENKLKQACYAEVYEAMGKPSLIDFEAAFTKLLNNNSKK